MGLTRALLAALALHGATAHELQAAETTAVAPADLSAVRSLDEVVVTGKLDSLSEARKAIVEAEDRFYARYNQLNEVDAFDINCRMETPTGSHLSFRVCVPRYVDEGTQAEAARLVMANATGGSVMVASAASVRATLMPEMKKRTLALVRKDPELLRALLERARLEQYYKELRAEKFRDGRWIVWD
ncbi:MAG: hypothetical protein ABI859_18155 [Pseudomonadota bacterium]